MSRPRALSALSAVLAPSALVAALILGPAHSKAQGTPVPPATAYGTPVPPASSGVDVKETSLQRIQRYVAKINHDASTPEGEEVVVAHLSQQLHVPADSLRQQHASWTLGYGEVAMVHGFARASKKPSITPDDVVAMRRSGKDWEEIGKYLGVKTDTVASKMKKNVPPKSKMKSASKPAQKSEQK